MLILSDGALEWAHKHISTRGDTDIFPLPFEYDAIAEDWSNVKSHLKQDLDSWAVRPSRSTLVPKQRLGLRPASQLDPLDAILYCALLYEVGSEFEAVRVPITESRVFSYRFCPDSTGQLYDPTVNFEAFRIRSLELAEDAPLVVMTDIADFFPRIYSHPMENAMRAASSRPDHARVLTKLVSGWNMRVSYGIPIGPSPSRLISEVTIADVDQALLAEGVEFCRYSDDYRLFVGSLRKAHEALAFLANVLHRHHGLTLQESKTEIVAADEFRRRFHRAERDRERHELEASFDDIAEALGLSVGSYEPIEYDDLDDDQKRLVDSLNLWGIVEREAAASRALDIPMMRFVLGRIKQLGLRDEKNALLGNLGRFAPVFREVVEVLISQAGLTDAESRDLGERLLHLFDHEIVGYLPYHRDWLLMAFVTDPIWDHSDRLIQLHEAFFDEFTRRAVTLALGRDGVWHWFKTRKHDVSQMAPWTRRAFIYGASCLPGDESKHWYQSVKPQLDPLELSVLAYGRASPL